MTAIRTGTRLEQLLDLRRRTGVHLEFARRRGLPHAEFALLAERVDEEIRAEGGTPPPEPDPGAAPRPRKPPNQVDLLLRELGVTAGDVKRWAVDQGLLDQVRRGRVALQFVEAYAAQHQTTHPEGTTP